MANKANALEPLRNAALAARPLAYRGRSGTRLVRSSVQPAGLLADCAAHHGLIGPVPAGHAALRETRLEHRGRRGGSRPRETVLQPRPLQASAGDDESAPG